MIRAFFPDLYGESHRTPHLTQEEQKTFYEDGLRPAVQELLGEQAAEWPATYTDEMFRARSRNGQLSFQSKVLPDWSIPSFGDYIRHYLTLNGHAWGRGIVFLHQVRGVKHSCAHSTTCSAARSALSKLWSQHNLQSNVFATGTWWIDVGVEIGSRDQNCIAWRADSHFHIVQNTCLINSTHADRITSPGSSKYTRDMVSHLPAVAGCRISPGVRAEGKFETQYLQMYTTDKSLTYHPEKGRFGKFITCTEILKGKADQYLEGLYGLYCNAIKSSYSLARVEMRVPLKFCHKVLLNLDEGLLRNSLVSFERSVWW